MMGMMGVRMNLLYVSARLFMNIVECRFKRDHDDHCLVNLYFIFIQIQNLLLYIPLTESCFIPPNN
jgi:hypothetical protein